MELMEEIIMEEFEQLKEKKEVEITDSDITENYLELIFTKNQEHVGFIKVALEQDCATLQDIELDLNFQGEGIGKEIVLAIERVMGSLGLNYIELYAEPRAIGFWQAMIYQQVNGNDRFIKYL